MNDRVRVYELARQMSLPNEDLIVALRELGYDIKSHSSTIDKHAVGLLIAQLGKKKQKQQDKPKTAKAAKPASKVAPPPEPVIVKPRVLSRRKPVLATDAASIDAINESTMAVPLTGALVESLLPSPLDEQQTKTASQPIGEEAAELITPKSTKAEPPHPETATESLPSPIQAKVEPEATSVVHEPKEPAVAEIVAPAEPHELEDESSKSHKDFGGSSGQGGKAPTPVPIRIAAPSIRPTPPRPPKSHRQSPSERHAQKKEEKPRQTATALTVEVPKTITLTKSLTVQELSEKMMVAETEVIKRLFMKGFMRTVNQVVELELAKELAVEMEYEVASEEQIAQQIAEEAILEAAELPPMSEEDIAALVIRPPVVTIMGHVDHGKTSLLDAIRQTKFLLTDSEAGGITQHIGAYHVEVPGEDGSLRQIVFLDTPGHEAFTAMRARGTKCTDIAILVVAADDGVMPQTIEAIDHAKAASVPIIVAVNKIDKAGADPDRVLSQLMEHDILPDKYGGETVTVSVSAKKRTGLDELLEMILLVADMQDLKANPDKPATGTIVEAELSRGKGAIATALVQNGTLREGDYIVAGSASGRVRALFDDRGLRVKAAGPSMPVEVLGLDEVPQAGDKFEVTVDIQQAKILVEQRKLADRERRVHRVTLESLHDMLEHGEVKELNIIVKADVQGTAEAIAESIKKLTSREVAVRVLRTASGDISENDVNLAASSDAIIIGFNSQPDTNASKVAEAAGVDIRTYSVIYQITDDLEMAIQGLIQPLRSEVHSGSAEIRQVFKMGKNLMIGGCYVTSGKISRGSLVRIERNGQTIYEGKLETLKRFKDDAKEVAQGFECGMGFTNFNDLQENDVVQAFTILETKREPTR